MSEWRAASLGEVTDIMVGPAFKSAEFTDDPSDVPLLRGINVGVGALNWNSTKYWPRVHKANVDDFRLRVGDVIVAMDRPWIDAGLKVAWIRANDVPSLLVQRVACLRAQTGIAQGFLRAVVRASSFADYLQSVAGGATVPHISARDIADFPLRLPTPGVQIRIAALCQAFDDLIEINERRVELLEDRATSLYREWFVRFRFPGHERARAESSGVGSIPAGWTVRSVASLAHFLNGYAFKPSDWGIEGPPIIKIKELKQGVTGTTPRYVGATLPAKYVVEPGELLFSWSADLGIYLWPGDRGLLNQHLFRVTPGAEMSREYLFHALQGALPDFRARAQGTTMKHIKRSALTEVSVLLPNPELMRQFTDIVAPMHATILALRQESSLLAAVRDLLLPRLVTGRLDISDIDLGDLLAEADVA